MYGIADLFDKRSVVGAKLEQIFKDQGYTKTAVCKASGISRPTLDKVLAGSLTSKTNYEKHLNKILGCLNISPDMLLGNGVNKANKIRFIRNVMRISDKRISEVTGIPMERLQKIESGDEGTLAELRDIALCLSTGVRMLQGNNFFEAQFAEPEIILELLRKEEDEDIHGFWGHVGILLNGRDEYLFFPITEDTSILILKTLENERMVIPCMNNKVLYLNMQNVKEIILNNFECDPPRFVNWDCDVEEGDVPFVVYEALEDYFCEGEACIEEGILSEQFMRYLDGLIEKNHWSEDNILSIISYGMIYYSDGMMRGLSADFKSDAETLSTEVGNLYMFRDLEFEDDIICVTDLSGSMIAVNMKNVSMIEMPLIELEDAIIDKLEWIE